MSIHENNGRHQTVRDRANQSIDETNHFLNEQNSKAEASQISLEGKFDKYGVEDLSQFSLGKLSMRTQYAQPKSYTSSNRIEILAMPKHQYHGKDFFQRQEFRGLFLADH